MKAEGFPGQRLVVAPGILVRQAEHSPAFGNWIVTAAGCYPAAPGHHVRRPRGTNDWIVILCRGGAGSVGCGDLRQSISANQLILLPPDREHEYAADTASPWSIEWLHLGGSAARAFCEALAQGNSPCVLSLSPFVAAQSRFREVWESLGDAMHLDDLMVASSEARLAMAYFWKGIKHPAAGGEERILELVKSLKSRLGAPADLATLARQCGYAPSHFSHLFRQTTGLAPMQYLHSLKMREACRLLDSTGLPVAEIARLLGFNDAFYFSRYFRKTMGISPRAYRKLPKG